MAVAVSDDGVGRECQVGKIVGRLVNFDGGGEILALKIKLLATLLIPEGRLYGMSAGILDAVALVFYGDSLGESACNRYTALCTGVKICRAAELDGGEFDARCIGCQILAAVVTEAIVIRIGVRRTGGGRCAGKEKERERESQH